MSSAVMSQRKSTDRGMTVERDILVRTADHLDICCDHYRNGRDQVVILAHGFYNSKDSVLIKECAGSLKDDYDVFTLDFRGHGRSQGLFYWTSKENLDLEAALNAVKPRYRSIGVVGFSLGAAISIITAVHHQLLDSLVAVSSPADFSRVDFRFWEMDVENDIFYGLLGKGRFGKGVRPGPLWLKKEKPIDAVSDIKVPVLYIHGQADWLIKPWHAQALFEKTGSKKKMAIIKNGPHGEYLIRKNKEEVTDLIKAWFQETLGK